VTKAARRLAFALKSPQPFGVAAHLWRQNFDGYPIAQQDMARSINRAHATLAEQVFDLILAIERFADK
jgi:hypothetical protein